MDNIKLSPRLAAVYDMAKGARRVTDVGTDHAYIPIKFALDGKCKTIRATDLRPAPLAGARQYAADYGVEDKIFFKLCDGLEFDGARDSDTVIIAGMGGETIIGILERAKWTKNGTRLILQPQSKIDELCLWLYEEGYVLCDARLQDDAGRLYVILSVEAGAAGVVYAEELLFKQGDRLLLPWLEDRIAKLKKAVNGMKQSRQGVNPDTEARLSRLESMRMEMYK